MDRDELLAVTAKLRKKVAAHARRGSGDVFVRAEGAKAEVTEFLRVYAGPKTAFYHEARTAAGIYELQQLESILEAFFDYVGAGLHAQVSPERRAQLDVVSDLLEQADRLLNTNGVHPAAPTVLIGATLEEFLRTWAESLELSIGNRKPGLQAYADVLRDADAITKQDGKDIISWAGTRNHAAHGEWAEVADPQRIRLMLEGVNLFMRKYGA